MAAGWRNRIVAHGEEAPDQLLANPRNWRLHPKHQQDALAGVLSEVGWVQDVIVNRTTGHVVDGHARVGIAISRREASVPVVYVELSEDEEAKVLATFDPLGAMAGADREQLEGLLKDVGTDDASLRTVLDGMTTDGPPPADPLAEWRGMPEFEQGQLAAREVVVKFVSAEDVRAFAQAIGQDITPDTKSVWYPKRDRGATSALAYVGGEGDVA